VKIFAIVLAAAVTGVQPIPKPIVSAALIPAVASGPGAAGARYVSSLTIANPHPQPLTVRMYVLPAAKDNTRFRDSERAITLPPFGGVKIDDPLATQWSRTGLASIYLEATAVAGTDGAFVVESRVLNVANPDATYGISIPGMTAGMKAGDVGFAADAQRDEQYRTNIGLVNKSAAPTRVTIDVFNDDGVLLGSMSYGFEPYSLVQVPITDIVPGSFPRATVRVTPAKAYDGELIGYISVIDGNTGDGTFSPIRPHRAASASESS
jgi:hypothetical protein